MKTIIYNADIANEGRLTRGYIVIDDAELERVYKSYPNMWGAGSGGDG